MDIRERVIRNKKQDRESRDEMSETEKEAICICTHSCMGLAVGVACVRGLRVVMLLVVG